MEPTGVPRKPSPQQFVIAVVLVVVGIVIAAFGLQGLLNPTSQSNTVAAVEPLKGASVWVELPPAHYFVSWQSRYEDGGYTNYWNIEIRVTDAQGLVLLHGNHSWSERSSCSRDDNGVESCSDPSEARLGEFDAAGGRYLVNVTVRQGGALEGHGLQRAYVRFADPARMATQNSILVLVGFAVAVAWLPAAKVYGWVEAWTEAQVASEMKMEERASVSRPIPRIVPDDPGSGRPPSP